MIVFMRTSRYILWLSLSAAILSFALYLSAFPAVFLTAEQANNVLLAFFGAACPSFAVGLIEYESKIRDRESAYLKLCERIYSEIGGLQECVVESIVGEQKKDIEAVQKYFDEIDRNESRSPFINPKHEARDQLIKEIEHCELDECSRFIMRPFSSSSRYFDRLFSNLDKALGSYYKFGRIFDKYRNELDNEGKELVYFLPFLRRNRRKSASIDGISKLLKDMNEKLACPVGQANLYQKGDYSLGDAFRSVKAAEEYWVFRKESESCSGKFDDHFCEQMYELVERFASSSSSAYGKRFVDAFGTSEA